MKNFNPPEGKAGEVLKTPFQKVLNIKVGSKVMLTYNVDTSDGLTNGARGDLIGILFDSKGHISKLIIKFEKDSVGEEKRRSCPDIVRKFPGGTAIEKINFSFSISKSKKSVINTANVIQFPVKLAFACTAHKIQGSTIAKPLKEVINVGDTRGAAMIYVMLSRVCSISQLFILDNFDETKMYPDMRALEELERLDRISLNTNRSNWERDNKRALKISSLNCRSLNKHFKDISSDEQLPKSDIIALQETWLEDDDVNENFNIPGYILHLNSKGRGKGIATYFKSSLFKHETDKKQDHIQLSKFKSRNLDVISLYRSQACTLDTMMKLIREMVDTGRSQLILGDFNFCYLDGISKKYCKDLESSNFKQLIEEPTHLEGNLLDHAYLRDIDGNLNCTVMLQSKYYTDHKAVALVIEKGRYKRFH